jgi:proteasome lid subunit RPN8/RPN11
MIDVILSPRCVRKLKRELRSAGRNEIGGVLASEQLSDGVFLVRDLSVQRNGTPTSFVRDPVQHRKFMRRFHRLTGNSPERFNYLGEWHSHPSFLALPSEPDIRQMHAEIHEPEQTSTFLVLLIVKAGMDGGLIGSTHAFRRALAPIRVRLSAADGASVREEVHFAAPSLHRSLRQDDGARGRVRSQFFRRPA